MHSWYSDQSQPFIYSDYTLFCAEVASTTNEMLLYHYLLDHAESKAERAALLSKHLDDIRSTFYRQTMFADFENQTHRLVEQGQPLLPEVLCNIHRQINADYYGPDFAADKFISYEWARIPHFYRAFYVYQYATGISAAIAIAKRIRTLGAPAIEDYKKFLRAGSSDHPIELLRIAGVDMASPQAVADTVEEFEETPAGAGGIAVGAVPTNPFFSLPAFPGRGFAGLAAPAGSPCWQPLLAAPAGSPLLAAPAATFWALRPSTPAYFLA